MRTIITGVLAASWLAAGVAQAATPVPPASPAILAAVAEPHAPAALSEREPSPDYTPIVVGLGAIAGVVTFNLVGLGLAALPASGVYTAGATVPAEMSVAMSRVYATSSAVLGAVLADYLYSR